MGCLKIPEPSEFSIENDKVKETLEAAGWEEVSEHYSQGEQTRRFEKGKHTLITHFLDTEQANEE